MAAWKQRREIRHGCEGRGWREQSKCRYIDMMGINHMKFSWREIENVIGPSLFLRNKGSERACMFLGASLLSSGSFTMKPPPRPPAPTMGGRGVGYPMSPRVFRLFGQRLKVVNRGNFFLWNPESTLRLESGIQILLTRNPKSKFIRTRNQESSTWNVEAADWNPESKTFLDYLTWVDRGHLPRISICCPRNLRNSLLKPFPNYGLTNQSLLASNNKSVYLYCNL